MAEMGRPTDYEDDFVHQVQKLCELGATDVEIGEFFGVSTRTIYRWKLEYPDFCQAMKTGKDHADERIVRSLYQKAAGYDFTEEQAIKIKTSKETEDIKVVEIQKHQPADTQAAMFWLKNRRSADWQDRKAVEVSGPGQGPIRTLDVSKLPTEAMEALLAARIETDDPADA